MSPPFDDVWRALGLPDRLARLAPAAARIPADERRHPPGCPDADWCRGNRACWWDCQGRLSDAAEQSP
jgi:hypothetical protein